GRVGARASATDNASLNRLLPGARGAIAPRAAAGRFRSPKCKLSEGGRKNRPLRCPRKPEDGPDATFPPAAAAAVLRLASRPEPPAPDRAPVPGAGSYLADCAPATRCAAGEIRRP